MGRRQQFLNELGYEQLKKEFGDSISMFEKQPAGSGETEAEGWLISARQVAWNHFERLVLTYTGGEPISALRTAIEPTVAAFERYGERLWSVRQDRNEAVFQFAFIDDYCALLQLIGLCFLLHRRDLLPRLAALQDGKDATGPSGQGNGGSDTIYEELMCHAVGQESRFQTDHACHIRPYENLFYALTESTPKARLKELDLFLARWYKDLAGTGWHDSHKPDDQGAQGGYVGYWSFEAGAAVLLLGIEDDSSLHKYLYYPKDLVRWSRQHAALSEARAKGGIPLRAMAGDPCPRSGWWVTPAKIGSRRRFTIGDSMPDFGTDYGTTIWQWDEQQ